MSFWNYYKKFSSDDLILRDYLAVERTILMNETTFLAYVRTAFTMIGAGATALHFLTPFIYQFLSWFIILSGLALVVWAGIRYKVNNERLQLLGKKQDQLDQVSENNVEIPV